MSAFKVSHVHTYSPVEEEPSEFESGTFRCVEQLPPRDDRGSDAPADAATDDEAHVRQALMAALFLLARQAARLNHRGGK